MVTRLVVVRRCGLSVANGLASPSGLGSLNGGNDGTSHTLHDDVITSSACTTYETQD